MFGQDEVIPPYILKEAKGLAIITVLKAGFLFSGRAGSGVIVARLPDNTWSAPSAIGLAGAGAGGLVGVELTDFVFILNTEEAVKSFSEIGTLTLGGNASVSAGPLGRNAEADASASAGGVSTVFAYSKSKGLFAGVSLEGSMIVERRETNRKCYGDNCTSKLILSGRVRPPRGSEALYRVLDSRCFNYDSGRDISNDGFYDDIPDDLSRDDYSRGGRYDRKDMYNDRGYNRDKDYDDRGYNRDRDYNDRGYNRDRGYDDRDRGYEHDRGYGNNGNYERDRVHAHDRYRDDYRDREDRGRGDVYDRERYAREVEYDRDGDRYERDNSYYHQGDAPRRRPPPMSSGSGPKYDNCDNDHTKRHDYRRNDRYSDDYGGDNGRFDHGYDRGHGNMYYSPNSQPKDELNELSNRLDSSTISPQRGAPLSSKPPLPSSRSGASPLTKVRALYDYNGQQEGDLTFKKDDIITVIKRTKSQDDWWTGELNGKRGLFPANYVQVN